MDAPGETPMRIIHESYTPDGFWNLVYDESPDWQQVQNDYDYVWAYDVPRFSASLAGIGERTIPLARLRFIAFANGRKQTRHDFSSTANPACAVSAYLIVNKSAQPGVAMLHETHLQRLVRPRNRSPHVSDWTAVVSEALFRLLEVASDDVDERIEGNRGLRIESVQVVHRDEARVHVPRMLADHFIGRFDIGRGNVIGPKQLAV